MTRALVLIAAVLIFREFLPRKPRRSPTAISPYMNSLDGLLSAEQLSLAMDEVRLRESGPGRGCTSPTSTRQESCATPTSCRTS